MPKTNHLAFQPTIQGRFIPRTGPSSVSVYPIGGNDNRFNAKMAELLACSSLVEEENEVSTRENPIGETNQRVPVGATSNSSNFHSKLLHRQIVNMLDSLENSEEESKSTLSSLPTNNKFQPITFGQLRQANQSIAENQTQTKSQLELSQQMRKENDFVPNQISTREIDREEPTEQSKVNFHRLDSFPKSHSPLLDQTLSDLRTSNEILARQYLTNKVHQNEESRIFSSFRSDHQNNLAVGQSRISSSRSLSRHFSPISTNPDELNLNRPPPPSYQSSLADPQRFKSTGDQNVVPVKQDNPARSSNTLTPRLPRTSSIPTKTERTLSQTENKSVNNNSRIRVPPIRYHSPSPNYRQESYLSSSNEQLNSEALKKIEKSSNADCSKSIQRDFSRSLYGREQNRRRRVISARKSFSDPVKKSIEQAQKMIERRSRHLTTNSSSMNTDHEHEEETDSTDAQTPGKIQLPFSNRRPPRSMHPPYKLADPTRRNLVPPQPALKRRIPAFLRVYSKASSSHDVLLQWNLFDLSELESFSIMMTRLYKNENLARVQLYEVYRSSLLNILQSKNP